MLKEIYLIDLVPQSGLFISKDAGHMVLLMLHIESIRQDSPSAALLGENRQVVLRLTRARESHSAGGGKIRPADHHQ